MATKPHTGCNMANSNHKVGPHTFCKQCSMGCDEAMAKRLQRHGQCDPCDGCFNVASPVCTDCEAFSNFEYDGGAALDELNATALLFNRGNN